MEKQHDYNLEQHTLQLSCIHELKVGYLTVNSSKGTIFILLPGDKLVIVLVMVAPLPVNVLIDIPGKWEELNM